MRCCWTRSCCFVDSAVSAAPAVPVPVAVGLTVAAVSAPSAAVVDSVLSGVPVVRALAAVADSVVAAPLLILLLALLLLRPVLLLLLLLFSLMLLLDGLPAAVLAVADSAAAVLRAWDVVPACLAFQASPVSRPADPVVRRPEHRLQELKTRGPP